MFLFHLYMPVMTRILHPTKIPWIEAWKMAFASNDHGADSKVRQYRWDVNGQGWNMLKWFRLYGKHGNRPIIRTCSTHTHIHLNYPGFQGNGDAICVDVLISSLHYAGQSQWERRERNWGNECSIIDQIAGDWMTRINGYGWWRTKESLFGQMHAYSFLFVLIHICSTMGLKVN